MLWLIAIISFVNIVRLLILIHRLITLLLHVVCNKDVELCLIRVNLSIACWIEKRSGNWNSFKVISSCRLTLSISRARLEIVLGFLC